MEKLLLAFVAGLTGFGAALIFDGRKTGIPDGALLAFEKVCPIGWAEYTPASGRFLLAAGHGEGLAPREVGQTGGVDEVGQVITRHFASSDTSVSSTQGVINPTPKSHSRSKIEVSEMNMPPFLVVKLCSYSQGN